MDIQATKTALIHLLLDTQEEHLLSKIKKIFDDEQNDWWDEMTKEERQEIKKGLSEADNKKLIPHKKILKNFDR